MSAESFQRRLVLERENNARAEAQARELEREGERIRKFLPPDPLAERRRLEHEADVAARAEAARLMDEAERMRAAHRPKETQPPAPPAQPWVTTWRNP